MRDFPAILGREIGPHEPPYLVAEISGNHGGSLDTAISLIEAAKDAGADAVKVQAYTPGELTTSKHRDLWELYVKAQTPRHWFTEIWAAADDCGIPIFASAFSTDGVKFLQDQGSCAIKIASHEIRDHALIEAAIDTGLPVIVSTGLATMRDLEAYGDKVIYLHCVSQYPSQIEWANLNAIRTLQRCYGMAGLSDHTPGIETSIAATALGAVMIEKHIRIDQDKTCIDMAYSLEPWKFEELCRVTRAIWAGMGDGIVRPTGEPRKR